MSERIAWCSSNRRWITRSGCGIHLAHFLNCKSLISTCPSWNEPKTVTALRLFKARKKSDLMGEHILSFRSTYFLVSGSPYPAIFPTISVSPPATFPFVLVLRLTYELLGAECASLFRSHLGSAPQNPSGPLRRSGFHKRLPTPPSLHIYTQTPPRGPLSFFWPQQRDSPLVALPLSLLCFRWASVSCVKAERSAKVNPGGLAASANVRYMMSLAGGRRAHMDICSNLSPLHRLSLVLSSGMSLSLSGGASSARRVATVQRPSPVFQTETWVWQFAVSSCSRLWKSSLCFHSRWVGAAHPWRGGRANSV